MKITDVLFSVSRRDCEKKGEKFDEVIIKIHTKLKKQKQNKKEQVHELRIRTEKYVDDG